MNKYTHRFLSQCPVNGETISYTLVIQTHQTIEVEEIVEVCSEYKGSLHEVIANDLIHKFPGTHTLSAHHHGVDIETVRVGRLG